MPITNVKLYVFHQITIQLKTLLLNSFNDFDNLNWSLMHYENYGLKGHINHLNKLP